MKIPQLKRKLEVKKYHNFELKDESNFDKDYEKEFKKNKLIKHVILLHELDASQYAKDILKHLAELNIEKGSEVLAAELSTSVERYDFAIQISKKDISIKDLKEKIKNEEEKYLRLFAEFENYKKRTTKERIDLYKTAGKEVIQGLIPVLEDFKRAVNPETGKFDDSEGINLILKMNASTRISR